jgi:predicted amidophosphoribosyltransferase
MPAGLWQTLADLVLPTACASCGGTGEALTFEVCAACAAKVEALGPREARPTPAPAGLPPCFALGEYESELRELILAFKERGRHRLARPLGALLAEVVAAATPTRRPLLLLYVPDTAKAARQRHGDHMRALANAAVARLREAGREALTLPALSARPRPDSAELTAAERAEAAREAFARRWRGLGASRREATRRTVVLLDDILTTGSTLAAAAELLADEGVEIHACAVLAATRRRLPA